MIDYKFERKTNLSDAINELYKIVHMLRSPEGCPFDRVQTKEKSLSCVLDEAYEYLDEVNKNSIEGQREELGDLVWNAFFLLDMSEEAEEFTAVDAINDICEKIVRRHEHVFGNAVAENPEEVLTLWNKYKETKEGHKTDYSDFFKKIPSSLPPLETAYEIKKKIGKTGLYRKDLDTIISKIEEELGEVKMAIAKKDDDNLEEEIGDLLFAVVNLSTYFKIHPNFALNRTNNKIKQRFQLIINLCKEDGKVLEELRDDEIEEYWAKAKRLTGI